MTSINQRPHLALAADDAFDLGKARGAALRSTLGVASEQYEGLFRMLGVDEGAEARGVAAVLDTLRSWRPEAAEELEGVAEGSGLPLARVVSLNSRTEMIALGNRAAHECSTITAMIDGHRLGVQTWDWHVEFDNLWHTHEVAGPGRRFVGLTEQGIVSKIGMNDAGLGLHFNILGHADDRPEGVPMHVLSAIVLAECANVAEALELIRAAPITSSSAFTMLDCTGSASVEISPHGVYVVEERGGSVQRTNHFQHDEPLAGQKTELYEPDSSERLALIRERLEVGAPESVTELLELLVSDETQPPLTCVADMAKEFGERWATLATVVTDPGARTLRVFAGMPPEALRAEPADWRMLMA